MARKRSSVPLKESGLAKRPKYPIETCLKFYMLYHVRGERNNYYFGELLAYKKMWDENDLGYKDNILMYLIGLEYEQHTPTIA